MEDIEKVLQANRTAARNAAALHFLFKASERAVKDKVVVVSPGSFSGNSKYIYGYLHQLMHTQGIGDRLIWLSHNQGEADVLRAAGVNAHVSRQDGATMKLLIETKVVFVSTHHFARANYCMMQAALSSAIKVQMWHGVPAKHIAYELAGNRATAIDFSYFAYDCLSADYVVTESDHVTGRYIAGFPNAAPVVAGSARTDILFGDLDQFLFWDIGAHKDIVEEMAALRKSGVRVVYYAPTYREARQDRTTFLPEIRNFIRVIANQPNTFLVIKNHNASRDEEAILEMAADVMADNVRMIPKGDDSYPYMREADVLITDYSSIYYDFLLTGRRVVFFQPDYEAYTSTRSIYDEQRILGKPLGHAVQTGQACADAIHMDEPADYAANRTTVRDKLFADHDGAASKRLIGHLKAKIGDYVFEKE